MQQAGISVGRMGESIWSLWEPADGHFDYAWMDRMVDVMGKANIKVILGTPSYSIPVWMWKAPPEMLARPLGGASVGYGMRQNMNTDDPNYRRYAERLIINLVSHYKNNPTVIGWQIDNETSSYGACNPQVFIEFVDRLKHKFVTTDALNKAWFLASVTCPRRARAHRVRVRSPAGLHAFPEKPAPTDAGQHPSRLRPPPSSGSLRQEDRIACSHS